VTAAWTAKIPRGWSCLATGTGVDLTQLVLIDDSDNMIVVSVVGAKDTATACAFGMAGQEGITPGPDTSWGGKAAKTATLTYENAKILARCVDSHGSIYMMAGEALSLATADLIPVMDTLSAGWVWK
jgi:hypothetical protein